MQAQLIVDTVIGKIVIEASDRGVTQICFGPQKESQRKTKTKALKNSNLKSSRVGDPSTSAAIQRFLDQAETQIIEFLSGKRNKFELQLDPQGTEFQKRVWKELQRIPFGETRSYRSIAQSLGRPGAARAVGSANGRNPLPIVVPCHRVIAADGSVGGYSGGLNIKRHLLKLEQQAKN